MTTVIPTTADSRFHATRGLAGAPHKWLSKKCKSLSKKCDSNRPSPSNLTSQTRDQWAVGAYRVRHPSAREAAMKRCAQCHGKLGLGVRSRNFWNGRWWAQLASVRLIAKVNTSWSVTALTLNNIFGTPSFILAVRRADVFARDGDTGG